MLNNILKYIFTKLFLSKRKRQEVIKDLKTNPNFRTNDEISKKESSSREEIILKLEKGEVKSILMPIIGTQKDFKVTKWYLKKESVVKAGTIICEIENENITIEFESVYTGKLLWLCPIKEELTKGTVLCKIEGI